MHAHSLNVSKSGAILLVAAWILIAAAGCAQRSPDFEKIALVAPFDGRYREIGYDLIPAARVAVDEFAARDDHPGLVVELVAFDDKGDSETSGAVAESLSFDPKITVVIGNWLERPTFATRKIYSNLNVALITYTTADTEAKGPVYNLAHTESEYLAAAAKFQKKGTLAPGRISVMSDDSADITLPSQIGESILVGTDLWATVQFNTLHVAGHARAPYLTGNPLVSDVKDEFWTNERRAAFVKAFHRNSLGAEPGPYSVIGYEATWLAIEVIAKNHGILINDTPVDTWRFNSSGRLIDAEIYLYEWKDSRRVFLGALP